MIDSWIFDDHAEFGYIYECPHCKFHLFVDSNDKDLRPEKCPKCKKIVRSFEDNEILNIIDHCLVKNDCTNCPIDYDNRAENSIVCRDMGSMIIDFIKCQKTETEKLKAAFESSQKITLYWCDKYNALLDECEIVQSEARKEFAERLRAKKAIHFCKCGEPFVYTDLFNGEIDNLLKEMENEKK